MFDCVQIIYFFSFFSFFPPCFYGGESPFPSPANACRRMPRVNSWNWIRVPARQVHCLGNLSYKWQNESTLHGSLSTCCCVTHHCRYRKWEGGREKCLKDHMFNCCAIINSDVAAASFFLSSMCNDIRIILSCKAGERSSLKNLCCLQRLMTKWSSCGIFSCGSSSWIKVYLVFKHGCDDWLLSVFFHLH